jgi:fatty acid desaturase
MTGPISPPLDDGTDAALCRELRDAGRAARAAVGASDLALLQQLKWSSRAAEMAARIILHFAVGPWAWIIGAAALAFDFSLEAQLNHSIMHGAYARIPGAGRFTPSRYETLAIPFQSKTWRDAHHIHHGRPSIVGRDPDTIHALFRVHPSTPRRWWHAMNTFVGAIFTFECWAFDYDRFLKAEGRRAPSDRGELKKCALYVVYQYVLFPVLAGDRWASVLGAALVATIVRNLIFTGLQLASSVGADVSMHHALAADKKVGAAHLRFQIETSKNFVLYGIWRVLCGGLDRHIEHHLYPYLPPNRLADLSPTVRTMCARRGIRYAEFSSIWGSLRDSLGHLARLSRERGR